MWVLAVPDILLLATRCMSAALILLLLMAWR
jgi:hypothetical protein